MRWRVLWTEIRRGPAPVVAVLTAGPGLLIVQGEAYGARWMSFASAVQYSLYLVAPLVIAVAMWHGGRDRHRKTGELLAATSRPRSAPVLVRWAALTIGTTAGLVVVIGVGAVQVAPRASYWGGGWWWLLAAAVVGMAAVNAVGMLTGQLLPYRALAPIVALGTFGLLLFMLNGVPVRVQEVWDGSSMMVSRGSSLVPMRCPSCLDGLRVTVHQGVSMLAWLLALVVAAIVAIAARRLLLRIAIWLLPAAAAWFLGYHGDGQRLYDDAAAFEPVCTDNATVCVTKVNAYDLDAATAVAKDALDRWAGVDGAPTRAAEYPVIRSGSVISLYRDGDGWHATFDTWPRCEVPGRAVDSAIVAMEWAMSDDIDSGTETHGRVDELRSWDEAAQQDWMSRYLAAAEACDDEGLVTLAEELE